MVKNKPSKTRIPKKPSVKLLKNAIAIAQTGAIKVKVHSSNTHYTAHKHYKNLEVHFEDGENIQADGHIRIYSDGKEVLEARVNYSADHGTLSVVTPPLNIKRPFSVESYIPGLWVRNVLDYE